MAVLYEKYGVGNEINRLASEACFGLRLKLGISVRLEGRTLKGEADQRDGLKVRQRAGVSLAVD